MKKTISMLSVAALLLSCLLCLSACGETASKDEDLGLWNDA